MIKLKAKAKGTGRVVNWLKFKKSFLVDQNQFFGITTVIPDVLNDVLIKCEEMDSDSKVEVISANGFFKIGFDMLITGSCFQVDCGRRLATRGLFPLNPIALEFGKNYDVIFTISADSKEIEQEIADVILRKYEIKKEITPEQD